jgi:hypothetical protein
MRQLVAQAQLLDQTDRLRAAHQESLGTHVKCKATQLDGAQGAAEPPRTLDEHDLGVRTEQLSQPVRRG